MQSLRVCSDKVAVSLSVLCSLHCLLFPVLVVFVPSVAGLLMADDDMFHKWLLVGVLPTSAYALFMGCKNHGRYVFMGLGFVGVALLTVAAFFGHDLFGETGEKYLTVSGSVLIAIAHLNNSRLCRKKQSGDQADVTASCC